MYIYAVVLRKVSFEIWLLYRWLRKLLMILKTLLFCNNHSEHQWNGPPKEHTKHTLQHTYVVLHATTNNNNKNNKKLQQQQNQYLYQHLKLFAVFLFWRYQYNLMLSAFNLHSIVLHIWCVKKTPLTYCLPPLYYSTLHYTLC